MRPADRLAAKLAAGEVILLDGATGTELQRRGVPMDGEAWCALATLTHPDVLRAVHEDYVRLGCDVVTANTFANARHMMARAGRGADTRLTYLSGCGTLLGSGALGDRGVRVALRRPRASAPGRRNGLMLSIHPDARTTPAVRAEIARSAEPTGELARRYGVSTETVRKWRKRGPGDCLDRSARPHKLPWKASEEERAVVCALRRATGFPLDDLT